MTTITLSQEGQPRQQVELDGDNVTVADIVAHAGAMAGTSGMSVFVNAQAATSETPVVEGDRVALARQAKGNS